MAATLHIPYLPAYHQQSSAEELALALDELSPQVLAYSPWQELQHRPEVSFVIAYGEGAIFLKYFVKEKTLRSTYVQPNDPVYNDSCVEFFIGFNGEENYYNLEFNCAGTCLAGFGSGKERQLLPAKDILKIKHRSVIRNLSAVQWELTLVIPAEVFIHHRFSTFRNLKARGNFFKCGDGLPEPHYLTWNDILSPYPEFHLKEFFGEFVF